MAVEQLFLPGVAKLIEQDVARITQQLGVIHPLLFLFFYRAFCLGLADFDRLALQMVERLL